MAEADINMIRVDTTDEENNQREERSSSWSLCPRPFEEESMEHLYQCYTKNQKDDGLKCFLVASILYDMYYLIVPCDLAEFNWFIIFSLLINSMLFFYCLLAFNKTSLVWRMIPHIAWVLFTAQLFVSLFFKTTDATARDNIGWLILMNYLLYIMLPYSLKRTSFVDIGVTVFYMIGLAIMAKDDRHLVQEVMPEYEHVQNLTRVNGDLVAQVRLERVEPDAPS